MGWGIWVVVRVELVVLPVLPLGLVVPLVPVFPILVPGPFPVLPVFPSFPFPALGPLPVLPLFPLPVPGPFPVLPVLPLLPLPPLGPFPVFPLFPFPATGPFPVFPKLPDGPPLPVLSPDCTEDTELSSRGVIMVSAYAAVDMARTAAIPMLTRDFHFLILIYMPFLGAWSCQGRDFILLQSLSDGRLILMFSGFCTNRPHQIPV